MLFIKAIKDGMRTIPLNNSWAAEPCTHNMLEPEIDDPLIQMPIRCVFSLKTQPSPPITDPLLPKRFTFYEEQNYLSPTNLLHVQSM